jgi:hypothetical protein
MYNLSLLLSWTLMSHTIKHYTILAYLPNDRLAYSTCLHLTHFHDILYEHHTTEDHPLPYTSISLTWYQQFSLTNFWGIRSLNNTDKVHFVQTEIILKLCYTGRSCFTWLLFAWFHFSATWKFTTLFKFTC